MTTAGWMDEAWDPPHVDVVLSGGPVEARFEEDSEPAPRRYVGFKQPATTGIGEPLLWEGDQA